MKGKQLDDLGVGILCWKDYDSLRFMLESFEAEKFLSLFNEKIIYFQEIDDEARKIAEKYGMKACGTKENFGIYGGFKGLSKSMKSKYILLLEKDLPLIEPLEVAKQQLEFGVTFLENEKAKVIQYKHLVKHGDLVHPDTKYRRFYPEKNAPKIKKIMAGIQRITLPNKAKRLVGRAPLYIKNPENMFPQIHKDEQSKFFFIKAKYRGWSNQPFMIEKSFFENVILEYVEAAKTTRRVNGFKNIEIELNGKWWWKQNFNVAMAPGMFTHKQIGGRGY